MTIPRYMETFLVVHIALCGTAVLSATRYVALDGNHVRPFVNWADGATNIQDAVDAAEPGDHVLLSNGVYTLKTEVLVTNPISVLGLNISNTIVSGGGITRCFRVSSGGAVLRNMTIREGVADVGGGVYLQEGGEVAGCIITKNTSTYSGLPPRPCGGGGVFCWQGGTVRECYLHYNSASNRGAAIQCWRGGTVANCLIVSNTAGFKAGGIACLHGGRVDNCTIAHNSAGSYGGGFHAFDAYLSTMITVENSIVYYNTAGTRFDNVEYDTRAVRLYNCCTTPDLDLPGSGNITTPPAFTASEDGNFHLSSSSPCIDTGSDRLTVNGDIEGIPRPLDGDGNGNAASDIGAFEAIHPSADTDSDGLSDSSEILTVHTSPVKADSDGDHSRDGDELIAGTDPNSASSVLSITDYRHQPSTHLSRLEWPTATGRSYTVVRRTDLSSGVWTNVIGHTDLSGTGGHIGRTISEHVPGFYRIKCRHNLDQE